MGSQGKSTKDCRQLREARRSKGGLFLGAEKTWPCQHLNFGFLTSRTQRKWFVVLGGSMIKNPPAMQKLQEMQVRSLGREEPLKEGTATHSCSCLENPMDTEASWATVHRVTKNWIRLK